MRDQHKGSVSKGCHAVPKARYVVAQVIVAMIKLQTNCCILVIAFTGHVFRLVPLSRFPELHPPPLQGSRRWRKSNPG
jgi:hypothetical protein